ncbi:hypothetical protein ECEC1846_3439, partial [Escherichia coli EC1846]
LPSSQWSQSSIAIYICKKRFQER